MPSRLRIRLAWLVAALLVIPSLSSCASARKKKDERTRVSLEESARSYNEALRWGQFETAIRFIAPADRDRFLATTQRPTDVRITEIRLGDIEIPDDATQDATVTLTRTFFRTNDLREQRETVMQRWYQQEKRWYVRFEEPK